MKRNLRSSRRDFSCTSRPASTFSGVGSTAVASSRWLAAGAWALWEYRRPGGTLNPQTKKDIARRRYEAQLAARRRRLQESQGGGTGKINVV